MNTLNAAPAADAPAQDWPCFLPAPEALGFGRVLAPVVVCAEHAQPSGWSSPQALPRDRVQLDIASGALQYGLSVFEGLKAFRDGRGRAQLFRPLDHVRRLQRSAQRLCLPEVSDDLLMQMMRLAVRANLDHLPPHRRGSLYLRPTLYAGEESLGFRRAARHALCIVATACSAPDAAAKRLWAERGQVRAASGGLGAAKTAANYAASLFGAQQARERGYDDALWLDAHEHRYLCEAGTMNVFVVLRDRVITPPLDGCILAGITRDSVMQLLRDQAMAVESAPIALDDLLRWQSTGDLREIFGTGTAARIASVSQIAWENAVVTPAGGELTSRLSHQLADLQDGIADDARGWRVEVGDRD